MCACVCVCVGEKGKIRSGKPCVTCEIACSRFSAAATATATAKQQQQQQAGVGENARLYSYFIFFSFFSFLPYLQLHLHHHCRQKHQTPPSGLLLPVRCRGWTLPSHLSPTAAHCSCVAAFIVSSIFRFCSCEPSKKCIQCEYYMYVASVHIRVQRSLEAGYVIQRTSRQRRVEDEQIINVGD